MKKSSKQYKKWLLGFALFTIFMLLLLGLSFLLPIDESYQISIVIVLLLLLITGMLMFKPRLVYYQEIFAYYKLKDKQDPPIKFKYSLFSQSFSDKLLEDGFLRSYSNESFTLYSKYAKDRKEFHLKRSMLIVFVIIKDESMDYQERKIIQRINKLEDALYKEKKRIFNYTVFVAKEGPKLTNEIKESCDNVSFSKVGSRSIININLFFETSSNSSYFLYSDSYSPSIYYRFAVGLLKDIIS